MNLTFKRHYRLLVLLVLAALFFTLGRGDQRVIAYTGPGNGDVAQTRVDYTNPVNLFDDTLVHTIRLIISPADYEQMLTTYQKTGEKDYFHADIIIDGVRVSNVGVRLKGNASLRTALGRGMGGGRGGPGGPPGGGAQPPGGGWPPNAGNRPGAPGNRPVQATPRAGEMAQPPAGNPGDRPARAPPQAGGPAQLPFGNPPAGPAQGMPAPGGQPGDMDVEAGNTPVKIPILIQFDRYVSGQRSQGYARLAIRSAGISTDEAMLQEPVTNAVVRLVGLPATRTAYTGLQLNNDPERLFTISEVIDEDYLKRHFTNPNGILYKAEFGARLSYQGEDPSAYASGFDQQTRKNEADLAPLIRLLRFLDDADQAAFEKELPTYLDVDAFATYLAVNNLLVNTDSFAGMGNNYYLYYDDQAQRFTLLMWDGNESLGKLGNGPQAVSYDLYYQARSGQPAANQPAAGQPGPGQMRGGGPGGDANNLTARFLATPAFKTLYEQKLQSIYRQAFASGALAQQVERYAALVRQASAQRSLVNLPAYEQAVAKVLSFITQRQAYLAATPLLGSVSGLSTVEIHQEAKP